MIDRRRGAPDSARSITQGDRRAGSRRLVPWMEPRVHPVPPHRWASFGQKRLPRSRCKVCGEGVFIADHGRCSVSLRAGLVEGVERTLDDLDRVIGAPPNPPADDRLA